MRTKIVLAIGPLILLIGILTGGSWVSLGLMYVYALFLLAIMYGWTWHISGKLEAVLKDKDNMGDSFTWLSFREGRHVEEKIKMLNKKIQSLDADLLEQKIQFAGSNLDLIMVSTTDQLTGAVNRKEMHEHLNIAIKKQPYVSILMADIDFFKKVNDTYGHDVGDIVLKEFCHVLRESVRPQDCVCRYGGEEFIVVCAANIGDSMKIAKRARENVESALIDIGNERKISITASFGVAQYIKGENPEALLKRADIALYTAKENGRNRVEMGGLVCD